MSDFFLHGNVADPRLRENYDLWGKYYDLANARLDIPGEHALLDTPSGFKVPLIVYRAAGASADRPRPTLLVGGGFDSNYEECMHCFGFPALERGYNVILYEGPGQPTLLHTQKVGFIHDWERVVTPIMDYLFEHRKDTMAFIDPTKVGLIGMSLGGFLSLRAAAFEPRLAAVIAIDGVYSFLECDLGAMPDLTGAVGKRRRRVLQCRLRDPRLGRLHQPPLDPRPPQVLDPGEGPVDAVPDCRQDGPGWRRSPEDRDARLHRRGGGRPLLR